MRGTDPRPCAASALTPLPVSSAASRAASRPSAIDTSLDAAVDALARQARSFATMPAVAVPELTSASIACRVERGDRLALRRRARRRCRRRSTSRVARSRAARLPASVSALTLNSWPSRDGADAGDDRHEAVPAQRVDQRGAPTARAARRPARDRPARRWSRDAASPASPAPRPRRRRSVRRRGRRRR